MGAEGGELERGGARIDKFADARRAFLRVDRCIEREVNARLCARFLSLDTEALCVRDQTAVVIGHVDDGSDAAGGSAARRPDEIFLTFLTAAVHLRVNGTRKNEKSSAAMPFAGWQLDRIPLLAPSRQRPEHTHYRSSDRAARRFLRRPDPPCFPFRSHQKVTCEHTLDEELLQIERGPWAKCAIGKPKPNPDLRPLSMPRLGRPQRVDRAALLAEPIRHTLQTKRGCWPRPPRPVEPAARNRCARVAHASNIICSIRSALSSIALTPVRNVAADERIGDRSVANGLRARRASRSLFTMLFCHSPTMLAACRISVSDKTAQ